MFRLIYILLVAICSTSSWGQENILVSSWQRLNLSPVAVTPGLPSYEEVQQLVETSSTAIEVDGFTHNYYWYRLEFKNQTDKSKWNIITKRYMDHVIVYEKNNNGDIRRAQNGNALAVAQRDRDIKLNSVGLEIPTGSSKVIFLGLKFANTGSTTSFSVVTEEALKDYFFYEAMLATGFTSIAFVLVIFNFFFYFSLRDKTYLVYEVFVISSTFCFLILLTPLESWINKKIGPIPSLIRVIQPFLTIVAALFVHHFLRIPEMIKPVRIVFNGLFISQLAMVLFAFVLPIEVFGRLVILSPLTGIFLLGCCIYRAREDTSARIYLLGLGCMFASIIVKDLYEAGVITGSPMFLMAPVVGIAIEMIIMSVAIGERIREKLLSLFHELQESESNLQTKIQERTAALHARNKRLKLEIKGHKEAREKIKKQQDLLIQSEKMSSLGMMSAGIAHELNNPLAIISGFSEHIISKTKGRKDLEKVNYMGVKILSTTQRISKIIRGLRVYARQGDEDPFRKEDINQIIEGTASLCLDRLKEHEINFICKLPNPSLFISCRAEQISQVILNLLNNAIDAIDKQNEPWIKVSVEEDIEYIDILVEDSGPGVPKSIKSSIFDPFFTTKEVGKGTGLGLSISKGIIAEHGGIMELDEDKGHTCFILRLPNLPDKVELDKSDVV